MKSERVLFADDKLEAEFNRLSDKDPIKKGVMRAVKEIDADLNVGRLITKDTHNKARIKSLLKMHDADNLRIYNLPTAWRLIYTVTKSQEIKLVALILDWMSHKDYEKMLR